MTTTATPAAVRPKSTKQVLVTNAGKELLAALGDPELAAKHYRHFVQGITDPDLVEPDAKAAKKARKAEKAAKKAAKAAPVPDPVDALVASGKFTRAQALAVVGQGAQAAAPAAPVRTPAEIREDEINAILEANKVDWARGRVYITPAAIEAQVRVQKTGSPEIVKTSGLGRAVAVLVFKSEGGDVAVQNLIARQV